MILSIMFLQNLLQISHIFISVNVLPFENETQTFVMLSLMMHFT